MQYIHSILPVLFIIAFHFSSVGQDISSIQSGVYEWEDLSFKNVTGSESLPIFKGTSPHFDYLEINATSLSPGTHSALSIENDDMETCLIIKDGKMNITLGTESSVVGPRGVILLMPGQVHSIQNAGQDKLIYYVMRYKSKKTMDKARGEEAGGSIVMNIDSLTFRPSARGGGIRYFDRPTAMCDRFEMHITQLNKVGPSHKPHEHEETEIILVISGATAMTIEDRDYSGLPGDLYFMNSGDMHGVRNVSDEPCMYFAFKWK